MLSSAFMTNFKSRAGSSIVMLCIQHFKKVCYVTKGVYIMFTVRSLKKWQKKHDVLYNHWGVGGKNNKLSNFLWNDKR